MDDLSCGKAGEHLVCADLILHGYGAFLSDQGLPFDVVADINGRLMKIQVKTTRKPMAVPQRAVRTDKYLFHVRRCGKGGRMSYQDGDIDLFALVAIDTKAIAYLHPSQVKQTMFFMPEYSQPSKSIYEKLSYYTIEKALFGEKNEG